MAEDVVGDITVSGSAWLRGGRRRSGRWLTSSFMATKCKSLEYGKNA